MPGLANVFMAAIPTSIWSNSPPTASEVLAIVRADAQVGARREPSTVTGNGRTTAAERGFENLQVRVVNAPTHNYSPHKTNSADASQQLKPNSKFDYHNQAIWSSSSRGHLQHNIYVSDSPCMLTLGLVHLYGISMDEFM